MATLVIGGSGLVGYEFFRQSKEEKNWFFTYRSKKIEGFMQLEAGDLSQLNSVLSKTNPETIILPAAMADVNRCEREKESAYAGNVGLVKNVVQSAKSLNISPKIVFFSTDYLFDGKDGPYQETAKPNPINYYGQLKLMCEQEIQASGFGYTIIRTTGIFGWELQRKNFFYRVLDNLKANKELVLPVDQYGNPTYVRDLVSVTKELMANHPSGIWNVVGPDYLNRVELARLFAKHLGLPEHLIKGVQTTELGGLAPRPLKAGLVTMKINKLGLSIRKTSDALVDMQERKSVDDVYSV